MFDKTFKLEQQRHNPLGLEGYSGLIDDELFQIIPESRTGMSINVLISNYESKDLKEIMASKLKNVDVDLLFMLQRFKALVARLEAFCIQISKFHKVIKNDYNITRILDLKVSEMAINPLKFSRMDIERLNEAPIIEVQAKNPLNPTQIDLVKKRSTAKPFFDLGELKAAQEQLKPILASGGMQKEGPVSELGLEVLSNHFPTNIDLFVEHFKSVCLF